MMTKLNIMKMYVIYPNIFYNVCGKFHAKLYTYFKCQNTFLHLR